MFPVAAIRVLVLVVGSLLAIPTVHANETLKLCMESADVRPWRTRDGKGLNFELIDAAAKRINVTVEYRALPWKRCLAELKANAVDGAFAGSFRSDRLVIGAYPGGASPDVEKRLHTDTYVVIRRKDSAVTWDGKQFSGLTGTLGIQLGYSVGEQLASMKIHVDDGSVTLHELLTKVVLGRVDAAAVLEGEVRHLLKTEPALAEKLELLPIPVVEKPYFLLLSHQLVATRPAFAERLWQSIEFTRKSAAYRKAEARMLRGGGSR
jgi:polar amino acid transport system substrate-binding protein